MKESYREGVANRPGPEPCECTRDDSSSPETAGAAEVGTVCVRSASTGLCGGQRVTAVPTATGGLSIRLPHLYAPATALENRRHRLRLAAMRGRMSSCAAVANRRRSGSGGHGAVSNHGHDFFSFFFDVPRGGKSQGL